MEIWHLSSCIHLRHITVSSSLHTDLMFSSAAIYILFSGAEASLDARVTCFMYVMIYMLFEMSFLPYNCKFALTC